MQQDLGRAEAILTEALAFWRQTENKLVTALTLTFLALVAWTRGDLTKMAELAGEGLKHYLAWEEGKGASTCLVLLTFAARAKGDHAEALRLLDEAYARADAHGYAWGAATARLYAAETLRATGRLVEASTLFHESLDLYWRQRDPWGTSAAITGPATIGLARRRAVEGVRLLGAADTLRHRATAFLPTTDPATIEAAITAAREQLKNRFDTVFAAGQDLPAEKAVAEARRLVSALKASGADDPADATVANVHLTPRERQVLRLVVEGRQDPAIAAELDLSTRTVERHVSNLLGKYQVSGRAELAALVARSDARDAQKVYPPAK